MSAKDAVVVFVLWMASGVWSTLMTAYALTGEMKLMGLPLISGVVVMCVAYFLTPDSANDKRVKELEREVKNLKTQLWVSMESSRYL